MLSPNLETAWIWLLFFFLIKFYNFQHNLWDTEGAGFEYELLHLLRKLVGGLWVVGRKSFEQPLDQFCK